MRVGRGPGDGLRMTWRRQGTVVGKDVREPAIPLLRRHRQIVRKDSKSHGFEFVEGAYRDVGDGVPRMIVSKQFYNSSQNRAYQVLFENV